MRSMAALYDSEGLLVLDLGRAGELQIDIHSLRSVLDAVHSGGRDPMVLQITAAAWSVFSMMVDPLRNCTHTVLTVTDMFSRLLDGHGYVVRTDSHSPIDDSPAAMQPKYYRKHQKVTDQIKTDVAKLMPSPRRRHSLSVCGKHHLRQATSLQRRR
jgi:hypothetical protein